MLGNSKLQYGWLSKWLHWLLAISVTGLFVLGLWMVELDYYSRWYRTAPDWHRAIGILTVIAMVLRSVWMGFNGKPQPLPEHSRMEILLARSMHVLLYLLVFAMGVSGYLMSSADGRAVAVFDLFAIPSLGELIENQEDVAGAVHEWLAYLLIVLVVIHAAAACKHHWIDRDNTLRRIL